MTDCEETTALGFEPVLAADGTYQVTVDVHAVCTATIVEGQLPTLQACSETSGTSGPHDFELVTGGTTRVETETTLRQSSPRTVDGIRWRARSFVATVGIRKDGVEIPAGRAFFANATPPDRVDECSAAYMVASLSVD